MHDGEKALVEFFLDDDTTVLDTELEFLTTQADGFGILAKNGDFMFGGINDMTIGNHLPVTINFNFIIFVGPHQAGAEAHYAAPLRFSQNSHSWLNLCPTEQKGDRPMILCDGLLQLRAANISGATREPPLGRYEIQALGAASGVGAV
jgi:hypothetical protein